MKNINITINGKSEVGKVSINYELTYRAVEELLVQMREQIPEETFHELLKHTSSAYESINIPAEMDGNETL